MQLCVISSRADQYRVTGRSFRSLLSAMTLPPLKDIRVPAISRYVAFARAESGLWVSPLDRPGRAVDSGFQSAIWCGLQLLRSHGMSSQTLLICTGRRRGHTA